MPPKAFVEQLCAGKHPTIALAMFAKGTPWTRVFVRMESIEAVNTLGGAVSDTKLTFGEELILLRDTGSDTTGIQVSGAGSFVLRWDGTCATVSNHEYATYAPGLVKNAPLVLKYLEAPMRERLLAEPTVKAAEEKQRAECQGAKPGQGSSSCQRASKQLDVAITMLLRKGVELPPPEHLP